MRATSTCLVLLFLFICTKAQSGVLIKSATLSVQPAAEVERGTNLTLTCIAQVSHADGVSPQYTYNFYKDYKPIPKVYPTGQKQPEVLTIPQARAFDSGKYQCKVVIEGNNMTSDTQDTQEIIVKGLQVPKLDVDKGAVREGESVSAICKAEEEKGLLTFVFKDGTKELYFAKSDKGEVQTRIQLRSGKIAHLSCSYSINIASRLLKSNISNVVTVTIQELDIRPTITIKPPTAVIEGDTVRISCSVDATFQNSPSLTLQLVKGMRILQQNMKLSEYNKTVQTADAGEYECSAMMNNVIKTAHANLTVKELFSEPVLTIGSVGVFENQSFTVTCRSHSHAVERINQNDVKYSIYRDGILLTRGAFDGVYKATAGTNSNGDYNCSAMVKTITKHSQTQNFTAKVLVSRPRISVVGNVVLGRQFHIRCFSEKGSFPITFMLMRNQKQQDQIQVTQNYALFSATIFSEDEIHKFNCEARNSAHIPPVKSEYLSAPVTVPVGKPMLTVTPVPDDVTEGHEVYLICSVTRGSFPISYRWYRSGLELKSVTVKSNTSAHIIHSVSSNHSGTYYCEAFNSASNHSSSLQQNLSQEISFTVRMARWKKGLIIGVCLLVVSMFVVFLVVRCRSKRGRETYSPPSVAIAPHA